MQNGDQDGDASRSDIALLATMTGLQGNNEDQHSKPFLKITEQPKSRGFRFRYGCEGPSHGGLPGENNERGKKTYPTVKIGNYTGVARIVVSLVTNDEKQFPSLHAHSLVGKNCNGDGLCVVQVGPKEMTAVFHNLGILHVTKRNAVQVLKKRILDSQQYRLLQTGEQSAGGGEIISEEKAEEIAQHEAKNMDLSVVRLCFQAFLPGPEGSFSRMLDPVYSVAIYDSKAPNAANLKICRMDRTSGSVNGGDEVYLLCDKVQKDDIAVRFFEEGQDNNSWESWGEFGPTDVHRQYAIVFKTPAYWNLTITRPVSVMVQLKRRSDNEVSEPKPFTYQPQLFDKEAVFKKRRKVIPHFNDHFGSGGAAGGGGGTSFADPGFGSGGSFSGFSANPGGGGGGGGLTGNEGGGGGTTTSGTGTSFVHFGGQVTSTIGQVMGQQQVVATTQVIGQQPPSGGQLPPGGGGQPHLLFQQSSQPPVVAVGGGAQPAAPPQPMMVVGGAQPQPQGALYPPQPPAMGVGKMIPRGVETEGDKSGAGGGKEVLRSVSDSSSGGGGSPQLKPRDAGVSVRVPTSAMARLELRSPGGPVDLDLVTDSAPIPRGGGGLLGQDFPAAPFAGLPASKTVLRQTSSKALVKITIPAPASPSPSAASPKGQEAKGQETAVQPAPVEKPAAADREPARTTQAVGTATEEGDRVVEEEVLELAERTAAALQDYSRTGDVKMMLAVQRHLAAIQDDNGDTSLHLAIINGHLQVIHSLLSVVITIPGQDTINQYNQLHQTPLHLAIITHQPQVVDLLMKCGADRSLVDRHGDTASHLAAQQASSKCLGVLLHYPREQKGSDEASFPELEKFNYEGYTPLQLAVKSGSLDGVKALLEGAGPGAGVELPDGHSGRRALHWAVEGESLALLGCLLLEGGADPNAPDYAGNTPLHLASSLGLRAAVALLVAAGSDPLRQNYDTVLEEEEGEGEGGQEEEPAGRTPLELATDLQVAKILKGERLSAEPSLPATLLPPSQQRRQDPTIASRYQTIAGDLEELELPTRLKLAELLDLDQSWMLMADALGLGSLVDQLKTTDTPTRFLLEYFQANEGTIAELLKVLEHIKRQDLVSVIKKDQQTLPTPAIAVMKSRESDKLDSGMQSMSLKSTNSGELHKKGNAAATTPHPPSDS